MGSDKPFVKSPAFQIYPNDFLADKNTLVMSTVEIGAYWLLLLVCWIENGLLDDMEELAGIARMDQQQFEIGWEKRIKRCFTLREDGKWSHKRLEKEREKQREWKAKSARGGKASAGKRKKQKNIPAEQGGSTNAQPISNQRSSGNGISGARMVQPKGNTSFSSSFSNKEIHASASAEELKPRDELFDSLSQVCRIDPRLCTTEQRGALNQTLGLLRKEGHTPAEVCEVGKWWFASDWRGKQGQAPNPAQVREVWAQAFMPAQAPRDEHPNAFRKGKMIS